MICLAPQHHECPSRTQYALLVAHDGESCFTIDLDGNAEGSIDEGILVCAQLVIDATPEETPNALMVLGMMKAIKKAKEKR